jgi:uncharacterized protein (TIGR02147 family)
MSIFDFTSYRTYLKDLLARSKAQGVSGRALGKSLAISSPNYLQRVVRGERNLTESHVSGIALGLDFSKDEARYLKALIRLDRAKSPMEYDRQLEFVKAIISKSGRKVESDRLENSINSHWLHPVVYEMALIQVDLTPKTIAELLRGFVTSSEAAQISRALGQSSLWAKAGLFSKYKSCQKDRVSSDSPPHA